MRIVSGKFKGRNILPPKNLPVRPTTDMAKEGLFNILQNRLEFEEVDVLDLFCGTGNISLEFASRGARSVMSVDGNNRCVGFVKSTFETLSCQNCQAVRSDVMVFIDHCRSSWNVIFADPPYDFPQYPLLVQRIFEKQLLRADGLLIVEHPAEVDFSRLPQFMEVRKYGKVHFSFLSSEA
jgi:16S rRNA (guanine(966)-N(2))-methyltransferase RsmD